MSKLGLARSLGIHPNNLRPPTPDVIIGKWRGWSRDRVRDGAVTERHDPPLRYVSAQAVARRLKLTSQRVRDLREQDDGTFPPAAACIEYGQERELPTRGWDGRVYGWRPADITQFKKTTGRKDDAQKGRRGRPPGSGSYDNLPRCLRLRNDSVHGDGRACQAVRRKINGEWAPACGIHLTAEERHTLGISSGASGASGASSPSAQAEGPPA